MKSLRDKLYDKIEVSLNGCLTWMGARRPTGYGAVWADGTRQVHRVVYELAVGTIPEGLVIDHLCRNRACVNPRHMEVVTFRENVLRGEGTAAQNARKTHCPNGHPYDMRQERKRRCSICYREYQNTYKRDTYRRRQRAKHTG